MAFLVFCVQGTNTLFSPIYANIGSIKHNCSSFLLEINCVKVKPHLIAMGEV